MDTPRATALVDRSEPVAGPVRGTVTLDYDARMLRRRRLRCDDGTDLIVDLPRTVSLDDGDHLRREDGALVAIAAAAEPILRVTGHSLARLAWHVGNRHAPCAVAGDHLVIRDDPVLSAMLTGLGATVTPDRAPFRPEGGAYGHGRTMGHDHRHPDDAHHIGDHPHD